MFDSCQLFLFVFTFFLFYQICKRTKILIMFCDFFYCHRKQFTGYWSSWAEDVFEFPASEPAIIGSADNFEGTSVSSGSGLAPSLLFTTYFTYICHLYTNIKHNFYITLFLISLCTLHQFISPYFWVITELSLNEWGVHFVWTAQPAQSIFYN